MLCANDAADNGKVIRLYFDDSGSRIPDYEEEVRTDGINGFALGGVLIDEEDVFAANKRHSEFVAKWDLRGPLHSTKLRGFREQFRFLRNHPDRDQFFQELEELLLGLPLLGIACVIDRTGYNARYKAAHGSDRWRMCKTAVAILVERAAKHADSRGAQLKVFFEESGKREDRDVITYVNDLKRSGMPFDANNSASYGSLPAEDFQRILAGDPNRITKRSPLVQVADMYLFPMIKGGYDASYGPYVKMKSSGVLIDSTLADGEVGLRGIKYSCFDSTNAKGSE